MQKVGLSLLPEQFQKLTQLINNNAIEITEVSDFSEDLSDNDQALVLLAELLKKTYQETQDILGKFL